MILGSTFTLPILRRGSTDEEVKFLQNLLNYYYYSLAVDGVFGQRTEAVVKAFQKSRGLRADGVVGRKTWEALQFAV